LYPTSEFKASSYFSIYSAEALAILYTLNYILDNSIPIAVIFSDSKSVIDTFASHNFGHSCNYIIYIIRQKLLEIYRLNHIVTIVWIPSHCGILGNETADCLAKNATSQGTPITDTVPHSDFYPITKKKVSGKLDQIFKVTSTPQRQKILSAL